MKSDASDAIVIVDQIAAVRPGVFAGDRGKLEAILFLVLGLGFLAVSPAGIHLKLLNAVHHSELWGKRSPALVELGRFYGLACLFLAGFSFLCARRGGSLIRRAWFYLAPVPGTLWNQIHDGLRKGLRLRGGAVWLLAAVGVGTAIRIFFLYSPMKWDESETFFSYVKSPWPFLFEYNAPNNHLLNSVLERISTLMLGQNPMAIRLPAFLAGIASVPLIYRVGRALRPDGSGYFAAAAAAIWPFLIFYSANGRGYSLVVFLTLVLVWIGLKYLECPTRAGVGLLAIVSALGLFTMPSMLFMVVGAGAWIAWLLRIRGWGWRSVFFEFSVPLGGLTIALTALLYTPVVLVTGGFEQIVHNRFVRGEPWGDFFGQLGPHLRDTGVALTWGIPPFALAVVVVLVLGGLYVSARRRDWPTLLLLPAVLISSAVVLIAQHRIPFERTWIFVLPVVLLVADAGFAGLLKLAPARVRVMAIGAMYVCALYMGARLVAFDAGWGHSAGEDFPEARVAARFLKPMLREGDAVRTSLTAEEPTFFYLWYDTSFVNPRTQKVIKPLRLFYMGNQELHHSFMWYGNGGDPRTPVTTEPNRVFYVAKKSECTVDAASHVHIFLESSATLDLPADRLVKLFDYQDMVIYRQIDSAIPVATSN